MMKYLTHFLFFVFAVIIAGCNIEVSDLFNKVEVAYDVEFDSEQGKSAIVTYYDSDGSMKEEQIEPGRWTYNFLSDDKDTVGIWVKSNSDVGYINSSMVVWYSETTDLDDYVDANTWKLPYSDKMGFNHVVSMTKCYSVTYKVIVKSTNGVMVDITYGVGDEKQETDQVNEGMWQYSECIEEGGYASVFIVSEAMSGTATVQLIIDYGNEEQDVFEELTFDFSTQTKSGGIGKPVG